MYSQTTISSEIAAFSKEYDAGGTVETQPRLDYPPYRSSLLRHPTKDLHQVDPEGVELWAPVFGARDVDPLESDLTIQHGGEPVGERMLVTGRRRRRPGRCAASSSRSGRPTPAAATCTSATSIRPRSTRTSRAWAGA